MFERADLKEGWITTQVLFHLFELVSQTLDWDNYSSLADPMGISFMIKQDNVGESYAKYKDHQELLLPISKSDFSPLQTGDFEHIFRTTCITIRKSMGWRYTSPSASFSSNFFQHGFQMETWHGVTGANRACCCLQSREYKNDEPAQNQLLLCRQCASLFLCGAGYRILTEKC